MAITNPISWTIDIPTLTVLGGLGWFLWQRYQALENRLDEIERQAERDRNGQTLTRQAMQANFDRLEYLLNALTETVGHKTKRLESGILTLSQALAKYSQGQYIPRHPSEWPTDDPPSGIL
jgi:hypothetical protein